MWSGDGYHNVQKERYNDKLPRILFEEGELKTQQDFRKISLVWREGHRIDGGSRKLEVRHVHSWAVRV